MLDMHRTTFSPQGTFWFTVASMPGRLLKRMVKRMVRLDQRILGTPSMQGPCSPFLLEQSVPISLEDLLSAVP